MSQTTNFSPNMKPILRGWFKDFCKDWFETPSSSTSEDNFRFECFCNYYLINRAQHSNESFLTFGTAEFPGDPSNDRHIDGVAIFINGQLCKTSDELEDRYDNDQLLNVTVHLTQAKNGKNGLDAGEILKFLGGVDEFLSDIPWSDEHIEKNDINETLVEFQRLFTKCFEYKLAEKPIVKLYWCTSHRERGEQFSVDVDSSVASRIAGLNSEKSDVTSQVSMEYFGAEDLMDAANSFSLQNACTFEIPATNRLSFPGDSDEFGNSFFGFVEGAEFLKIIAPNGELDNSIFNENVRDFMGRNTPSFKSLAGTLSDDNDRKKFVIQNNGVTIVASKVMPGSKRCDLENYQVVNGCQTSNAIYEHRDQLKDVYIPVRFVETLDPNVVDSVTLATNSQTAVKPQDMVARTKTARDLEQLKGRDDVRYPIAFERREGQYLRNPIGIPKNRILQKKDFTAAYVACVLSLPHQGIGYADRYMQGKKDDIWLQEPNVHLLYACGYLSNRLFRHTDFDKSVNALKYHITKAAFDFLWPEFSDAYAKYVKDRESKSTAQKVFEDQIGKFLQRIDNDEFLKESLVVGTNAALVVSQMEPFRNPNPGKNFTRANAKTEPVTEAFDEVLDSLSGPKNYHMM